MTDASVDFGEIRIFEGLFAQFASKSVTALVGPSGSGKSTLLSAMAGYTRLSKGSIGFVFEDGKRSAPDSSLIAWVPQGSNALLARSVLDNVMVGVLAEGFELRAARKRALGALEEVGLARLAQTRLKFVSGGERQRVGFARALASGKPLIFADEPSASLDAANTENIASLLRGLRTNATVVVATHDQTLISAAERIVRLRSAE